MGNSLCKDRINQTSNSKSPVDRVIGRCAEICPSSLGKRKHFWDKQILETAPPHQTQPKMENTGWHNASLTVPDSPKNNGHPVAPPRKKRPSRIRNDDTPTGNGYNEFFSGDRADSTTGSESQDNADVKDFSDFEKVPLNRAAEKERESKNSEATNPREDRTEDEQKSATLTHKVSKVGNKKSDKFFGENLSDCLSDEPVVHSDKFEDDKIGMKEESTAKEKEEKSEFDTDVSYSEEFSEEMIKAINKERGALLFAMRNATDDPGEDVPDNVKPVEEPLIVPKRVVRKHVCDEEENLHPHLHHNHSNLAPDPNAPKKPQRDFTKYKKTLEDTKPEKEALATSPLMRDLDHDEDGLSNVEIKSHLPETVVYPNIETNFKTKLTGSVSSPTSVASDESDSELPTLKRVSESIPAKMSQSEKILRRCLSTQSFLTPELAEKIAQQASFSHGYLPEDYITFCNDGSGMAPNSKLEQKRTYSPMISQVDREFTTDIVELANKRPSFSIGTTELESLLTMSETQKTNDNTSAKEHAITAVHTKSTTQEPLLPTSLTSDQKFVEEHTNQKPRPISESIPEESRCEDISKVIKSFLDQDDLTPKDVLILLDEEFGELLHSPALSIEDQNVIQELRNIVEARLEESTILGSDIKQTDTTIPKTVQDKLETLSTVSSVDSLEISPKPNPTPRPEISSEAPSNTEKLMSSELPNNDKRRHSIDELDHWFDGSLTRNKDVPERRRKREASLPGYLKPETVIEELNMRKASQVDSGYKMDLDKPLNKEESPIISTINVLLIDTIPEDPKSEAPIETDKRLSDNQNDNDQPIIINNITNNVYEIPQEDKRKSVGHSLLLKFLDVERTNNYQ